MPARRAAVLGSPISHSLSPTLHRAAYAALGLDWTYDAIDCDEVRLPAFIDLLDDSWAGLSLTMPLKRAVLPLLDECSELVAATGVANTVLVRDGRTTGENTDVAGIVAALREAGVDRVATATVFGGGATAVSAVVGAAELGAREIAIVARSAERSRAVHDLAQAVGAVARHVPWPGAAAAWASDLVVSTVPAGAADVLAVPGGWPGVLLDVVYDPWPTALGRAAAASGARVVGGLAMLVHQAARQVELMTGLPAPVGALQVAGEAAVLRR
jgi:shikimate dehydrogenase